MKRKIAGVLLPVVLAACGPDETPPESLSETERESLCADIDNYYECGQVVEDHQLAAGPRAVSRSGDTLTVRLTAGATRTFVDTGTAAETVRYTYAGHLDEIDHHRVNVYFYEGSEVMLVHDETGRETRLPGSPVPSPDGARVAVGSFGGVAGYSPNALQVWRVTADGLEREWEVTPRDWGADNLSWQGPATLRFDRLSLCEPPETCAERAVLRLRNGEWNIEEAGTP